MAAPIKNNLKPVVLEDVRINFLNFAGKAGPYNKEGERSFCVFLDEDLAENMKAENWNIKYLKQREEDDVPQAYLNVAVRYREGGKPPKVTIITSLGKQEIGEDLIDVLDWAEIAKVDLIINPSKWDVQGNSGIKAYCRSLFVTIREDELDMKYSDVPVANRVERGADRLAIDSGVVYGEVVDD